MILQPQPDPAGGVRKAAELGYKKIAATIADAKTAKMSENESESGLDLSLLQYT